jgi:hypothetical protein
VPAGVLTWIWAAGTVAWLVPAALLALGLLAMVRIVWPGFVPDHGMELAAFIATWGVLGMAGAAALARLLLGEVAIRHRAAIVAAGIGLAIAAVLQVALHDWAVAKIGYYEPDIIGPTTLLPFGLAALAVALFGVAVAPLGVDLAPRLSVMVGGLLALVIVALNLPGAVDGIAPRAVLLAITLGIVAGYVLVGWAIALRR